MDVGTESGIAGSPILFNEDGSRVTGLDAEWLAMRTGLPVKEAVLGPLPDAGGLTGTIQRVYLKDVEGQVLAVMILKTLIGDNLSTSVIQGLAREALFFNDYGLSSRVEVNIPKVYYAFGDMGTGRKMVLMEAINGIQSGLFFGPGTPLNKGKNLEEIAESAGNPSPANICRLAVIEAAKLHAPYWNKVNELNTSESWLRHYSWYFGKDRDTWEAAQNQAVTGMQHALKKVSMGASMMRWEPTLLDLVKESIAKISWEMFQKRISEGFPWTLVHGDYHPANMMYTGKYDQGDLVILDWEVVGVGSGPQDIAQYMISHASPSLRRSCESSLLEVYQYELRCRGVQISIESCKAEYIIGGIEKWVWLLGLLAGILPDSDLQYFHDQMFAFMTDHKIDASKVGQPRP